MDEPTSPPRLDAIVSCLERIAVALESLVAPNTVARSAVVAKPETPFPWKDRRISPRTANVRHWLHERPKTIEAMFAIGRSNVIGVKGCTRQIGKAGLSEIDEIMCEYGRERWMSS